jgi:hypothetical protein
MSKRYRVRYFDPRVDAKTEAFDRKADAEAFDLKVRSDIARGEFVDIDAGKITLGAYAESWLRAQTFDPSTREAVQSRFRNHVYPSLGPKELRALAQRPSIIQAWMKGGRRWCLGAPSGRCS